MQQGSFGLVGSSSQLGVCKPLHNIFFLLNQVGEGIIQKQEEVQASTI